MVAKMGQEAKREKNRLKRAKIDSTTNGYMINLAWGVFVIILLRFVETGYLSADTVLTMPVLMKTFAAIFAAVAIGLFACGKINLANHKKKFYRYCAFSAVLAIGSLWIGFFNDIRNFFVGINPAIANVDSRWWISRGMITIVAIYLVVTLILTTVKITLIEKGKK